MIQRVSSFKDFTSDRKTEFLSVLAYNLTIKIKKTLFSSSDLDKVFKLIHEEFSLDIKDKDEVIQELEGQTGLFLQSGYDSFEYAHKSLQEYLTAEHLVKLPGTPRNIEDIALIPNELAIATAISTDPSIYLAGLILNGFDDADINTVRVYLTRILLEKPDFKTDPLFATAILRLRTLRTVKGDFDNLITQLIESSPALRKSILALSKHYFFNEKSEKSTNNLSSTLKHG